METGERIPSMAAVQTSTRAGYSPVPDPGDLDGGLPSSQIRPTTERIKAKGRPAHGGLVQTLDLGYDIVPVNSHKAPMIKEWQTRVGENKATKSEAMSWGLNGLYTGIITGEVVGLDFDILDRAVSDAMREFTFKLLGQELPYRVGKQPKFLLAVRTDTPFKKQKSTEWIDHRGEKQMIEVLGIGQQFVATGVHQGTGKPYKWHRPNGTTSFTIDMPRSELPSITLDQVNQILDHFDRTAESQGWEAKSRGTRSASTVAVPEKHVAVEPTPELVELLRDAMKWIPMDDRDEWINVGMACKTLGDPGFEIWDMASRKSDKYDADQQLKKWIGLNPAYTNPDTIFRIAERYGWQNPSLVNDFEDLGPERVLRSAESNGWTDPAIAKSFDNLDDDPAAPEALKQEQAPSTSTVFEPIDYCLSAPRPTEYVIQGAIGKGTMVIAAPPGAGKTCSLVTIAAVAAHLCDPDSPLRPELRRRVVYVVEDPEQAETLVYGMRKHRMPHVSDEEFKHWFTICATKRLGHKQLAQQIKRWCEQYRYKASPEQNNYVVEPLIVLDTSNASIEVESENDNAEVGRVIAAIKSALGSAALWIITHTSKIVTRDNVSSYSARGASAFEGDANATAYLIDDDVPNSRFLVLGKQRITADHREIEVNTALAEEIVPTPWRTLQTRRYRHGVAKLPEVSRTERKEIAKAAEKVERSAALRSKIQDALEDRGAMTKTALTELVGGKAADTRAAINTMVEDGTVVVVGIGQGGGKLLGLPGLELRSNRDGMGPTSSNGEAK